MKENNTPFVFGKTVSMFSFTNREEEFAKLKSNLVGGINTMLVNKLIDDCIVLFNVDSFQRNR